MPIAGLPVKDAAKTRKVVLEITPNDIKKGNTKNAGLCAAAQACMRQLNVDDARVHVACIYVKEGDHWTRFRTPRALRTEIVAFDRGGQFMPGEYTITPFSEGERLDAKKKKPSRWQAGHNDKTKKGNKARKVAKRHKTLGIRARGANV